MGTAKLGGSNEALFARWFLLGFLALAYRVGVRCLPVWIRRRADPKTGRSWGMTAG